MSSTSYSWIPLKLSSRSWQLRNRYIHVILGQLSLDSLLAATASRSLTSEETRRISLLLEAQRERQRMFSLVAGSSRILTDRARNNVAYAAQAVRLAYQATGVDLEPQPPATCSASPASGLS